MNSTISHLNCEAQ